MKGGWPVSSMMHDDDGSRLLLCDCVRAQHNELARYIYICTPQNKELQYEIYNTTGVRYWCLLQAHNSRGRVMDVFPHGFPFFHYFIKECCLCIWKVSCNVCDFVHVLF